MKIVSYNLRLGGHGLVHWNKVFKELDPDLLLVQETFDPREHLSGHHYLDRYALTHWKPVTVNGKNKNWGSGLFINTPFTPLDLPDYAGWVSGAEVSMLTLPDGTQGPCRVFSVHTPRLNRSYPANVNSILDMLLDYQDGHALIIGGDFNLTVSRRHDSEDRKTSKADLKIQERLREQFGLMNCWQMANPDTPLAQTLRWSNEPTTPYHCDGIFVPNSWRENLVNCCVLEGEAWDTLSDHNPMAAEFSDLNKSGPT